MTNKEILQSNVLDILFENRNKDYGAYALRRDYNNRMLIALGIAMSVILLFVLINILDKKNTVIVDRDDRGTVILTPYNIDPDKPIEPEKPKAKAAAPPVAQIKDTPPKIVDDKVKIKDVIPDIEDRLKLQTGPVTIKGPVGPGLLLPQKDTVTTVGTGKVIEPTPPVVDFTSSEPEFPGGQKALEKFLLTNLNTPDQLEAGDKKTVRIRFKVDKDGSVSAFEITASGGSDFDREVIRVCRKMPRWKPAVQNGSNVSVNYMLPVTFMGIEQ